MHRGELSKQGQTFVYNLAAKFKNTDVSKINLTFEIGNNFMEQGKVIDRQGHETVDPGTGRASASELHVQPTPFTNNKTRLENLKSQFGEFGSILQNLTGTTSMLE